MQLLSIKGEWEAGHARDLVRDDGRSRSLEAGFAELDLQRCVSLLKKKKGYSAIYPTLRNVRDFDI